jgi:hypothetical protein
LLSLQTRLLSEKVRSVMWSQTKRKQNKILQMISAISA